MTGYARTAPSLALTKYWGKASDRENTPATPSLAVTLEGFSTETTARISRQDGLILDGEVQDMNRYRPFFENLRSVSGLDHKFFCESHNDFPTAAGLASSASGFAALAGACLAASGLEPEPQLVSEIARYGSASAARSAYGGFTLLPAGGHRAEPVEPASFWPEFRVLAAITTSRQKPISSRKAMTLARKTSPFYAAWVDDAAGLTNRALEALRDRDLDQLGNLARLSYLRMTGTMVSSNPPVVYWRPETAGLIGLLEELRAGGVSVYETMDAGPQVKCLCLEEDAPRVEARIREAFPSVAVHVLRPAESPVFEVRTS